MSKINFLQLRTSLVEKTLTAAELRKREEVAKAIKREHPGMNKAMKMAIATATAKRVAEDAAQDFIAKGGKITQLPYKKPRKSEKTNYGSKHIGGQGEHKSGKAANTASSRVVGEDAQLDELKLSTVMSYANKRATQVSDAPAAPFVNKVSKRISKNAAAGIMGALQRKAGIKPTSEEAEISEKYYGYDSMGNSLKPGSDEGEPSTRRTYPKGPVRNPTKLYHQVPFHKKDEAKKEGMKWDSEKKKWYHISPTLSDTSKFHKEEVEYDLEDFTNEELEAFLESEGEQLDELSYNTLNSFMKGRRKQISKSIGAGTTVGTGTPASKKLEKHVAGYRKAWAKRDMKEAVAPGSAFDPNYKSQVPKKPGETAGFDSKKTPTGTIFRRKVAREEVEQVDEISKAKTQKYLSRSMDDFTHQDMASRNANTAAERETSAKKKTTRSKGITRATNRLTKEDIEQVDELNRDTVYSYNKKADADVEKKHSALSQSIRKGDAPAANKTAHQMSRRLAGIERAEKRLNSESVNNEQIDELKKSTVASYTSKVVDPVYGMPRSMKKLKQRLAGLQRAHARVIGKKATSEEVNIEEELDFKKEAAKHMKDLHSTSSTPANKAYAQKMLKRALEASKMKDKTAAHKHYMMGEETVEEAKKVQMHKPGWMLRADPVLAAKFKEIEDRKKRINANMRKYGGKTSDEIAKMAKK